MQTVEKVFIQSLFTEKDGDQLRITNLIDMEYYNASRYINLYKCCMFSTIIVITVFYVLIWGFPGVLALVNTN